MSRVYLKVPGSFVFIEPVKKSNPEEEEKRISRLVLIAVRKYFSNFSKENNHEDLVKS
jgi:hypothetical protein